MKGSRVSIWLMVAVSGLFLSGCSLVSEPALLGQTQAVRTLVPNGLANIEQALRTMDARTTVSYDMKATLDVATGRYVREVDYFGSVRFPNTVSMDMTIGGNNYIIYQTGNLAYYMDGNAGNRWLPMQPVGDLHPWNSLASLLQTAPPRAVYRLPDQVVVSWPCHVYQFETVARPVVLPDAGVFAGTRAHTIPHAALYTVFVDKSDGLLRQIEVQSTVGIPDLGTSSVTSTQLFFNNNARMTLPVPQALVSQIEQP